MEFFEFGEQKQEKEKTEMKKKLKIEKENIKEKRKKLGDLVRYMGWPRRRARGYGASISKHPQLLRRSLR